MINLLAASTSSIHIILFVYKLYFKLKALVCIKAFLA